LCLRWVFKPQSANTPFFTSIVLGSCQLRELLGLFQLGIKAYFLLYLVIKLNLNGKYLMAKKSFYISLVYLICLLNIEAYKILAADSPAVEAPREKCPRVVSTTPLSSVLVPPTMAPGVYESDDISHILSFPLRHFGSEDIVVFDCDEVLQTGLDPFYFAHYQQKTSLSERLCSQSLPLIDKFDLYRFLTTTYMLIDKRTPLLIKALQLGGIKCIVSTGLSPTILPLLNIDCPSLRLQTLKSLGFDFTKTFSQLPFWGFSTLLDEITAGKASMFKDGVIFSKTPKHITLLELFKKLSFKPKRVVFIDDSLQNVQEMFGAFSERGIECWSYRYSKRESLDLRSRFPKAFFDEYLAKIETFVERLVEGVDVDAFLKDAPDVQLLKLDDS
jgi:hypothetical protein